MPASLFGHLAHNFSAHPENLATEALAYILRKSSIARGAFRRFLETTGGHVPRDLLYETQASGEDDSIPDLVALAQDNTQPVICEAKFWAGLTENQPVTYLSRLPSTAGGILLFLAPARRLPLLWPELLRRCSEAGLIPAPSPSESPELLVATLPENKRLAAGSWRMALNAIRHALETEGDLEAAADVRQLEGLCERMDAEAFLPLRGEDLSPSIASRIIQFNELVDTLTEELVESKIASTAGFRATPTYSGYGRYMEIGEFGCMLQTNAQYWSSLRETPIWLSVKAATKPSWTYSAIAKQRLNSLEHEVPSRLLRDGDVLLVPLHMPLGADRDGALHSLRGQLRGIVALLTSEAQRGRLTTR